MDSRTSVDIKEIAGQLDCGFRAFLHKTSGQLLFIPDLDSEPDADPEAWEEELKRLKKDRKRYDEIPKWTPREAFESMHAFADQEKILKCKNGSCRL